MQNQSLQRSKTLVILAMLCAISYVVMFISKTAFAPLTVAGILTFDLKDVIIAIGGFLFGPLHALSVSVVVSLIEMVTVSETGPIGLIMNILSTAAFVCPAAYIYQKRHTPARAVGGLIMGVLAMAAVMMLWNYLITPIYYELDRKIVADMLLPIFLPFNLLKGSMNAAVTMLLYKPVVLALRKAHLVPQPENKSQGGFHWGMLIISFMALVTVVLLILVFTGII